MSSLPDSLLKRFLEFIEAEKLIAGDEKILLAVSGGLDSVVMTNLFNQTRFDFGIAHCNFSLRGNESDKDEIFTRELSETITRPFYTRKFDTENYARENHISIQEAARKLRYEFFEEIATKYGYSKISTAHHLNDSIETFFINLFRNSGPRGLRGIPVINGNIIRPLLFARRNHLEEYAGKHKIIFREDSSNESDKYLRNRIRHHLIPELMQTDSAFEENTLAIMAQNRVIDRLMSEKMNAWKDLNIIFDKEGDILLPLSKIPAEDNAALFLSYLLYTYDITKIDCDKLLSVKTPGKIFHSGDFDLLRDREFVIIKRKRYKENNSFTIDSLPAKITYNSCSISIEEDTLNKKWQVGEPGIQWVDAESIILPLKIRPWKSGDAFHPLGMKGKKKISDFFTDVKMNRFEKDNTLLLLSGNDIVCILGHRIDERFKITSSTKKTLRIAIAN